MTPEEEIAALKEQLAAAIVVIAKCASYGSPSAIKFLEDLKK